ncbi:MAG: DUF190 domain-containing protein [Chlamydiales bacterium]|nr:DUF190 domain-containing protein [Chlamydiia bacterium]MCP5507150.1 DUF190 domain-containing protein [Chlamydiales bacterium]
MDGFQLKFYTQENRKHRGILLYEWLLEKAKEMGLNGGSAFRAMAGFGRHGTLHEEHFFELPGNVPVEVIFVLSSEECENFLALLDKEKLNIFYVKFPIEFGVLNGHIE